MVIASQPAVIESPVELEGPTYLCLIPLSTPSCNRRMLQFV